jgi:phosphoglycolate phosphatase
MSDLSEVRTILFDLDGVLVDSRVAIPRSINFALECQGLAPRSEQSLHSFIGPPLQQAFGEILESAGADPELVPACVESYRARYRRKFLDETLLMPGIEPALRQLDERYALAVVTSKPGAFARPLLERFAVADCFLEIFGPPLDPGHHEGKALTLERAMELLGIQARSLGAPAAAAIVGDRHFDVEAGRAMGLATVGVSWGIGSFSELRRAGADHIVDSPAELVRLFAGDVVEYSTSRACPGS